MRVIEVGKKTEFAAVCKAGEVLGYKPFEWSDKLGDLKYIVMPMVDDYWAECMTKDVKAPRAEKA